MTPLLPANSVGNGKGAGFADERDREFVKGGVKDGGVLEGRISVMRAQRRVFLGRPPTMITSMLRPPVLNLARARRGPALEVS